MARSCATSRSMTVTWMLKIMALSIVSVSISRLLRQEILRWRRLWRYASYCLAKSVAESDLLLETEFVNQNGAKRNMVVACCVTHCLDRSAHRCLLKEPMLKGYTLS